MHASIPQNNVGTTTNIAKPCTNPIVPLVIAEALKTKKTNHN